MNGGLWAMRWPTFNAELAKEEEVEIVVQVNGQGAGKGWWWRRGD